MSWFRLLGWLLIGRPAGVLWGLFRRRPRTQPQRFTLWAWSPAQRRYYRVPGGRFVLRAIRRCGFTRFGPPVLEEWERN